MTPLSSRHRAHLYSGLPCSLGSSRRCQLIEDKANTEQGERKRGSARVLGGQSWSRDLSPDLESFADLLTVGERGKPVSVWAEVLRDRTLGREEALRVARGLEPLEAPLPLPSGLMRVFCSIVPIPMLAMFHAWKNLALGRGVTFEFIGDDDTG